MMPGTEARGHAAAPRPEIAIFRNNLFRVSEPFIAEQARQLQRYRPFHLGRLRFGATPAGTEAFAVADLSPRWPLPRAAWQMLTRDVRPYQRLLAARRPALIHAHFGIDGVYALPLARSLGVPLVTSFHGYDATLSTAALLSSPAWAHYPLHRRGLAREGDLFLCASAFIRERVLALGFPAERTRVHYIGIDWRAIAPRAPQEETPTILHVARLVEVKGTRHLIEAFADVARAEPDARLVLIGDGPLRGSLQALVRRLGLTARVDFLGARPHAEVMAWMRRASALVLPSVRTRTGRTEGLGMVLLEAAATGVPLIGSRQGGIPEVVVSGETGLLVDERDFAGLAHAMRTLLGDAAMRARMGAEARARVERHFDLRRQTAVLEGLYDEVLAQPRGAHR